MKQSNILTTAANVAVIGGLLILLMGPGGVATTWWNDWRDSSEARESIAREWSGLTRAGGRLDGGSGPVRLAVFSDYQCPYCRDSHRILEQWIAETGAGVVLRHLPLTEIHPLAADAARAAICAEEQDRFRDMNTLLFSETDWEEDPDWRSLAARARVPGLDRFMSCMSSESTATRLREDVLLAERLGIGGTPTFVHQGGILSGSVSPAVLSRTVAVR